MERDCVTKRQIDLKQVLVTAVLALLIVIILTSVTSKTLLAQTSPFIMLSPSQGPPGTIVQIDGEGFPEDTTVTISFNGAIVATTQTFPVKFFTFEGINIVKSTISCKFTIPPADRSANSAIIGVSYSVIASDAAGHSAKATLRVTSSEPSPSPTDTSSTPTNPPTNPPPYYTYQPTPAVQSGGFWSPAVIAVIGVIAVVVVIIPMTFMLRNRSSKHETLLEKEPLPYRQDPYGQSNRPTSTYNQSTSPYSLSTSRYSPSTSRYSPSPTYGPTVIKRYGQSASNVQQPTSGRTCPHCKQTVRGDINTCPYCYKKLR
jgi:hypothetical protein